MDKAKGIAVYVLAIFGAVCLVALVVRQVRGARAGDDA
jgi:hypothetical protein